MAYDHDAAEYTRMKHALVNTLEKYGGYEPAVDEISIDQMLRSTIQSRKIDAFLNTDTATEYTYTRVIDSRVKLAKIIDTAMQQLAISRRDRLTNQTQTTLLRELKNTILREVKNAKPDH